MESVDTTSQDMFSQGIKESYTCLILFLFWCRFYKNPFWATENCRADINLITSLNGSSEVLLWRLETLALQLQGFGVSLFHLLFPTLKLWYVSVIYGVVKSPTETQVSHEINPVSSFLSMMSLHGNLELIGVEGKGITVNSILLELSKLSTTFRSFHLCHYSLLF